jgi:hypothetical protein
MTIWILKKYEKTDDYPVGEYHLSGVTAEQLRSIFNASSDDPMYDCYPVTSCQVKYLEGIIKERMDLISFDYFVECMASD